MKEEKIHDPGPASPGRIFNLRAKVMFIFIVLALVPLAIIGWFSLRTTENLIVSMVVRELENVAVDKVALMERWLDERKADLMVIAGTSLVRSMNNEKIGPYLDLIQNKYGVYKNLAVVSGDGRLVCSTNEQPPALTKKKNPYRLRDRLYMSNITYAPRANESTFLIAAPVFGQGGDLAGTVYGSVGTNKIISHILNVSLGKTGECYLVDKKGRFLAHKEPRRILTENISQSESFKNIFEKRDPDKPYLDYRGIEVLGTSMKVAGTDWYIVVEQDRKEAFQSAESLKHIVLLTLLLFVGCALMLTWMLSYHIVRPIRHLSKYAGIIGESKFERAMTPVNRRDEIGMLYRAFQDMSAKLQQRQNHLEQKVDLKEAELKETDLILKKTKLIAEQSEKFAAMGRMGAAVAHEIRTPLTSLKLFMESMDAEIGFSPEDKEDFQIAMEQISRIEATINRFLDFTKPQDLVYSEISVPELVEDVLIMVRPMIKRQECTLDIDMDKAIAPVYGDRKLLAEALVNLLVNALEAIYGSGRLSITVAEDRFAPGNGTVPCLRIDISDTGHGIKEEQIENLFDPFFTTKASGTGLGLPLVFNTIQNHGGVIRVKSREQRGTTFSVYLPLNINQPLCEADGKDSPD
ncbi:MAG: ATP-binding protein [Desulfosalsimonadaceae bacterium]